MIFIHEDKYTLFLLLLLLLHVQLHDLPRPERQIALNEGSSRMSVRLLALLAGWTAADIVANIVPDIQPPRTSQKSM